MIVRLRSGGYDAAARLRLPRPDPRLDRPGGHGRRRLVRAARRRQHHELPPRPRRRDRQGLRGHPADDATSSSAPAFPARTAETREELAGGRPRGARLPRRSPSCSARRRATAAGRGGGMHIGDFSTGHLGANAIVGGSVPIATGAAMAHPLPSRPTASSAASPATAPTPTASSSSRSTGRPRTSGPTTWPATGRTACRSSTSSRTTTTA